MQMLHTVHCTLFYRILNIISLEDEQTLKHFNIMHTPTLLDNKIIEGMQLCLALL